MATKRKPSAAVERPRHKLGEVARQIGCCLGSLRDIEQLAGVNIQSETERRDLWWKICDLFNGPTQKLFDSVMDHCAEVALRRIETGELCLVPTRYC